ncbi:hypothetical protein BB561_003159 [Smittium simulii]|uniref:Histone acetyltransferase n=1 Tax=Smittium simulii TaxID=133385 RepID=A0A2T9YMM0_9FUNG|nr:hypothetical protein BB561_003159 [Smittium simulii]
MKKESSQNSDIKLIDFSNFSLKRVYLSGYWLTVWYQSPYPEEYCSRKDLYICEKCLKYMKYPKSLLAHKEQCDAKYPKGLIVYEDSTCAVYQIDGKVEKLYCQNLCLLSKLFLDQKTLYYDVSLFLFYILYTKSTIAGCDPTFVGYFSKEKKSVENYNLACVLTFPQFRGQHHGYEISKLKRCVGSPEKPLSSQGFAIYKSYWRSAILLYLLQKTKQPETSENNTSLPLALKILPHSSEESSVKVQTDRSDSNLISEPLELISVFSIEELALETGISIEDILSTLDDLYLLSHWKDEHTIYLTHALILKAIKTLGITFKKRLDPLGIIPENLY